MKSIDFEVVEDDYNIESVCGIRYIFQLDLTVKEVLSLADTNSIDMILGRFNVGIESSPLDNYISFNKYGKGEFNIDAECANELKKHYLALDEKPITYTIELCDLSKPLYNKLPSKFKEAVKELKVKRPSIPLIKTKVNVCNVLEGNKRTEREGSYIYCNKEIPFVDHYLFTNLPREIFKKYKPYHKKFYYEPLKNTFSSQQTSLDTIQKLFDDIALNGIREPIVFEIGNRGQLASLVESEHRFIAAMYLGLPIIPACLVYRQHKDYPFIGTDSITPQDPLLLEILNKEFSPELIFNESPDFITDSGHNDYYEQLIEEVKALMIEDYPNKIYDEYTDFDEELEEALVKCWSIESK